MGKKKNKQARLKHGANKRNGDLGHAGQFRNCMRATMKAELGWWNG